MAQAQPVSFKSTYKFTYRCAKPDMDKVFYTQHTYSGTEDDILLAVKYRLGHYGAMKAELINQEKI